MHGWFARWRWGLVFLTQAIFYGLPWLVWNGRQAVLFDLGARKFYIFGAVFWPQDVIYLAVLLILAALSLFLFTAVAGRLWCGYACPQTVYTDIFQWIERKIEGDRLARIRLDAAPLSLEKFGQEGAQAHRVVRGRVVDRIHVRRLFRADPRPGRARDHAGSSGRGRSFWMLFYGFATYGNAGWMREQVCKYMCPYARFQSVMFDKDTLVITYDRERGEPRGSRPKSAKPARPGPRRLRRLRHLRAGVSDRHRHPPGAAVRVHRLRGLHRRLRPGDGQDGLSARPHPLRDRECADAASRRRSAVWKRVLRPRTLVYSAVLLAILGAAVASLAMRNPLKVDVIRDRGALAREAAPGVIENVYRVQVMNTDEKPRRFRSPPRAWRRSQVVGVEQPIAIGAAEMRLVAAAPPGTAPEARATPGTHRIELTVQDLDDAKVVRHEQSSFIFPR